MCDGCTWWHLDFHVETHHPVSLLVSVLAHHLLAMRRNCRNSAELPFIYTCKDYLSQVCVVVLSVVMKQWKCLLLRVLTACHSLSQFSSYWCSVADSPLTDCSHPLNPHLAALRTPPTPSCCRPTLPPFSLPTLLSFLLTLLFSSCSLVYFFILLDSISVSSFSFPSLHPAATTKALFLSIHWRLVWSRTHARCSALRDRLAAHWGESKIQQERERKWERGEWTRKN